MGKLERLPGWAKRLDEMSGRFSEAGLHGLLDHHAETNTLGELLAQGIVKPADLRVWFTEQVGRQKPAVVVAGSDVATGSKQPADLSAVAKNPQSFWAVAWQEILGEGVMRDRKIVVPPLLSLKAKTDAAISGGLGVWIPVFLPKQLTEPDYPAGFIKPQWGQYLTESAIKRRPLPGRWVMVETINKSNWDDQSGYGDDPLAQALGLTTRFSKSWDDLHETHLPKVAKLLGLGKKAVRLLTAEEWNLIGNLFNWLNANRNMTLPDLGSTNSWEWAENSYGGAVRLLAGGRGRGGLAGVGYNWRGGRGDVVGFRVLAVL